MSDFRLGGMSYFQATLIMLILLHTPEYTKQDTNVLMTVYHYDTI